MVTICHAISVLYLFLFSFQPPTNIFSPPESARCRAWLRPRTLCSARSPKWSGTGWWSLISPPCHLTRGAEASAQTALWESAQATARDSALKTHLSTLFSDSPPAVQERLWHSPETVCSNTEQSKAPGIWTSNTAQCGLVAYGLLIMAALRCADSWGWLRQDYARIWAGYDCLWASKIKNSNKEYIIIY